MSVSIDRALGAAGYLGSPAEKEGKAEVERRKLRLKTAEAEVTRIWNSCHDAICNGRGEPCADGSIAPPEDLRKELSDAQAAAG
jgi:hypothetical protein